MALPTTNLSMSAIQTEFGGSNPISLSEYYKGGANVSAGATDPNTIPTSGTITIGDFRGASAAAATWAWQQTYSSIVEDVTRTFIIEDTSGTTTSGTFNWSINGTTADFSAVSGSGTINASSEGSFNVTPIFDGTLDGPENFILTVTFGGSTILTQAFTVTDPVANLFAGRSTTAQISEGGSFTMFATSNKAVTGTVDFSLTGTATFGSDYTTSGATTGTTGQFTFSNSTTSDSVTIQTIADNFTDGAVETVINNISNANITNGYISNISNPDVQVTIADTSQTPTPTYAFSAGSYNVTEGSSSSITVNTTNVSNGTTLYWTILNGTTSNADFTSMSGSFTINSNTGSFNISAASDSNNESTETATLQLRTVSTSGTIQDTAALSVLNVANINLTPATDTLPIVDEDGTVSASGGIQLSGSTSANTYNIGTIIDGFQTTDHSNVWITGGDPSDYEARVTVTSGTVNSNVSFTNFGTGTSIGTWTTLSGTSYVWAYQTTSQLSNTFTITLQIRDSATQTVQDSATVELNFETVFVPA